MIKMQHMTAEKLWQATMSQLKYQNSPTRVWLEGSCVVGESDSSITVALMTSELVELCQGRGYRDIRAAWRMVSGAKADEIKFAIREAQS